MVDYKVKATANTSAKGIYGAGVTKPPTLHASCKRGLTGQEIHRKGMSGHT